jgi:hypothetical protein
MTFACAQRHAGAHLPSISCILSLLRPKQSFEPFTQLQIEQYHLGEEARRAYQKENHFFILTVPSLSNGIGSYTPREKGRGVYQEENMVNFCSKFIIALRYFVSDRSNYSYKFL